MNVRTRFAPSPTGRLHLGNVRAAVFNWLFARRHRGAFILRVEDTDVERNVEGGEEALLADLRWLGLDWDEGPDLGGPHAPYRQSARGAHYDTAVEKLLDAGAAYPCFCSEEDLLGTAQEGKEGREVVRYDGRCRHLTREERAARRASGSPEVVRFAVPDGLEEVAFTDEVFGEVTVPLTDVDDFVLRRSDGRVTYNFGVVVDDVEMAVSHVIRGVGHLSNMPKQVLLFDALGAPRPVFAHLPTVLGTDGKKLSKRTGATAVSELRARGVPPDAVVNYVSLLGWSDPEGREVMTREELIESVSLDRVGKSDTQLDPEKLAWIAQQHIAREDLVTLTAHVLPFLDASRLPAGGLEAPEALVDVLRSRLTAYGDVNRHLGLVFPEEGPALEEARAELARDPGARAVLVSVRDHLAGAEAWEAESLGQAVRDAGAQAHARGRALFHPVRQALTGTEQGPDLGKVLAALGRQEALRRLDVTLGAEV